MILRRALDLSGFDAWLSSVPGGRLAATSRVAYVREAESFLNYAGKRRKGWKRSQVEAWLGSREMSASTATRALSALKKLCEFAGRPDATKGIHRPKRSPGVPRRVEGLAFLLNGTDPTLRLTCIFLAETALRVSEACQQNGCYFEVIDEGKTLRVHGKGDKDRFVPMSETAQSCLTLLGGRLPFTVKQLQAATKKLGFNPHRLRDTAACEWAENEVDLSVIQDLLGHSSPVTTRKYTANTLGRLRRGVEKRRTG